MAGDKSAGKNRKATRDARTTERRAQVMTYVLAGATLRDIAAKLKISKDTVQRDKMACLKELAQQERADASAYRALEDARLDEMFFGIWPDARSGDLNCIATAMNILARKAKLYGYDSPERLEVSGPAGQPVQVATAALTPEQAAQLDAPALARLYFDADRS